MKEDIKKLGWRMMEICHQVNRERISQSLFRQESRKLAEQYANQRVIEELASLKGLGVTYTDDVIDERIKELKQQIWKEHTKQSSGYSKDI